MGRYKCHKCSAEHSTDNVVAFCAGCFHALEVKNSELLSAISEHVTVRSELVGKLEAAKSRLAKLMPVVEAARAVKESGAGALPDYANQKSMDKWAIGIKRIVELCATVDALAAPATQEKPK